MRMKQNLLIILSFVFCTTTAWSQPPAGAIAPDFTQTDLDGNVHHLYDYLDQGKIVFLEFFATWCGPCWALHEDAQLKSLYGKHGPNGSVSNDIVAFMIEIDDATGLAQLMGQADGTQGDWISDNPIPILDIENYDLTLGADYNVFGIPQILAICPETRQIYGDFSFFAEQGMIDYFDNICTLDTDARISANNFERKYCSDVVSPRIQLENKGTEALNTCQLSYSIDGATPQTYEWTGSLAANETEEVVLPESIVSSPGNHSIAFWVDAPNNTDDDNEMNNYAALNFYRDAFVAGTDYPYLQDFEDEDAVDAFFIDNPDGYKAWHRSYPGAGYSGNGSMKMELADVANQGEESFTLPPLDFSNADAGTSVLFQVAHPANYPDQLSVYVSTACDGTETLVYQEAGATINDGFTTGLVYNFPALEHWTQKQIDLSDFIGNEKVYIRFEAHTLSGNGNNIFIDDINVVTGYSLSYFLDLESEYIPGLCPGAIFEQTLLIGPDFGPNLSLNITGLPAGLTYQFNEQALVAGASLPLVFSGASDISEGVYNLTYELTDGVETIIEEQEFTVYNAPEVEASLDVQNSGNSYSVAFAGTDYLGFFWTLDGEIDYTTNTTYTVSFNDDAIHQLCLIAFNECDQSTICVELGKPVNTTEELDENNSLILYPNPVKEQLIIKYEGLEQEDYLVRVLNAHGQLLVQTVEQTLDVADFPGGVYLLELSLSSGQTYTRRFVKQ